MQHHKNHKDLYLGDLFLDGAEEDADSNLSINLLTVASTGNAAFLDELLKAGLDPDIGDSKGRTPLVCSFVPMLCPWTVILIQFHFVISITIIGLQQLLLSMLCGVS